MVPGKYDGLYVTHKSEDHEDWKKRREAWRSRKPDGDKKETDKEKNNSEPKKLVLSDNLKAALLTRCDLTGAQADALIKEAQDESDF